MPEPDTEEESVFPDKEQFFGDLKRAARLMVSVDDRELAILKGHLLIEEKLIELIETQLPQPEHLDLSRTGFEAERQLAWALVPTWVNEFEVWEPMKKLNELRNHLAHHTEVPELDERTDAFLSAIPARLVEALPNDGDSGREFHRAVGGIHAVLHSIILILKTRSQSEDEPT